MSESTLETLKTTIKQRPFFVVMLKQRYFCFNCEVRYWMVSGTKHCPYCGSKKLLIIQDIRKEGEE